MSTEGLRVSLFSIADLGKEDSRSLLTTPKKTNDQIKHRNPAPNRTITRAHDEAMIRWWSTAYKPATLLSTEKIGDPTPVTGLHPTEALNPSVLQPGLLPDVMGVNACGFE